VGQPLEGHTKYVTSVAYSPDGRTVVSCSGDTTIRMWDVSSTVIGASLAHGYSLAQSPIATSNFKLNLKPLLIMLESTHYTVK
jgi:WD40 repeat protein